MRSDTDPALIHRVYDPRTFPVSIYHYCGHYTVYAWRRDCDTATPGRYPVVVDTQRAALPAWARRP